MYSILDRYIATRIIMATGLVTGILLALMVFFVLVDAVPDYGHANFGLYEMLRYVVLSQPRRLYEVFPVATLIGTLLGLSSLAVNAELVAMRAAGVSIAQLIGAAMKVGLLFAVVALVLGEYAVPVAENQAQLGKAQALAKGVQLRKSGLWLRDKGSFINIGEVLPDLTLLQVNIYSFENGTQLRVQTRAARAVHTSNGWQMERVRESEVSAGGVKARVIDSKLWETTLTPDVVGVFAVKPDGLSMQHLVRYIDHLRHNGQSTERYRLTLWQKLLMPVAVGVMVLLATPFALGQTRSGRLSQRVFAGVILGLVFVVVTRIFGHFGLLYGLSPFLGPALPIVLFLAGALFLLRRSL